jgi:uncharacterized protein
MLVILGWILGVLGVAYVLLLMVARTVHDGVALPGTGRAAHGPVPWFAHDDLQIPIGTASGGTVHAWWITGGPEARRTVLFFHGNGYPLEREAAVEAPALRRTGANLLLMDYRGYGSSSRVKPSGTTTAADARAGLRYLTENRGIPLAQIWICGRSIGSAVAVRLATEFPGCAGLILISPITNTVDVKPVGPLLRPLRWLGLAKDFDSRTRIARLQLPLLIVTGTRDTIGTPAMAAELHRRAPGRKRLVLIEGADHRIWILGHLRIPALMAEMMGAQLAPDPGNEDRA